VVRGQKTAANRWRGPFFLLKGRQRWAPLQGCLRPHPIGRGGCQGGRTAAVPSTASKASGCADDHKSLTRDPLASSAPTKPASAGLRERSIVPGRHKESRFSSAPDVDQIVSHPNELIKGDIAPIWRHVGMPSRSPGWRHMGTSARPISPCRPGLLQFRVPEICSRGPRWVGHIQPPAGIGMLLLTRAEFGRTCHGGLGAGHAASAGRHTACACRGETAAARAAGVRAGDGGGGSVRYGPAGRRTGARRADHAAS